MHTKCLECDLTFTPEFHEDKIEKLQAENARYRKALEFYADETNIEYGEYQNDFEMTPPYRYGAHAREALKGVE